MSIPRVSHPTAKSIPNIPHSGITPLSLRTNFLWNFAGNAIFGACQWGMLMVIAKLGTPEMVGKYSLGVAICLPVVMFSNLQLRVIQATDAKNQNNFGDYLGLRLITFTLSLLIIAGIVGVSGYQQETALVILVIGLAKGFDSISDIFYGLAQKYERMDRIAISLMLRGPLSLLGMGLGVYLTSEVFWGAVGFAGRAETRPTYFSGVYYVSGHYRRGYAPGAVEELAGRKGLFFGVFTGKGGSWK
jgi:O-antigen/teichoic acid export membrane protein